MEMETYGLYGATMRPAAVVLLPVFVFPFFTASVL
jgi:hypothetical protein